MTQRKGGLGRGLGALIPGGAASAAASELPGARFAEIPVGAITPNRRQPRQHFEEESLAELVSSIREVGLLQPVVVRELSAGRYELVMGERRWRASREAGLTMIPAIVRDTPDSALLRDALLENLHREQLNPLEEAAAYQQLLQEFDTTHEELAKRIGRSRPQISNTIRLLQLPAPVQRRVAAGVLSAGHARALLGLTQPAAQERLAERIVAEGLSVRAVEELVHVGLPSTTKPRAPREAKPTPPAADEYAGMLSELLETPVRVEVGRRKGRLVIEFGDLEDLERVVELMIPGRPVELATASPPAYEATQPGGYP